MVDGKLGCWTEAAGEEGTVQDEQRNNSSALVDNAQWYWKEVTYVVECGRRVTTLKSKVLEAR